MGRALPRWLVLQGVALTFLGVDLRGSQPVFVRGATSGAAVSAPDTAPTDLATVAQAPTPPRPATIDRAGLNPVQSVTKPAQPIVATAASSAAIHIYRVSCLECHDSDGRGEAGRDALPTIPNFTDAKWQASRSDAELSHSILEGKGKSMPKMKNKLGSVHANQMVAFVRAFQGGKQVVQDEPEVPSSPEQPHVATGSTGSVPRPTAPPQPDPKALSLREGSRLFKRSCVVCHGADGKGSGMRDSLPTIPDFTVHTWQERRNNPQLIVSVLDGKGAGMPPFRDKLAREQIRDLVAFIRSFDPSATSSTQTASDDFEVRFEQLLKEFQDLRRRTQELSPAKSSPLGSSTPSHPR